MHVHINSTSIDDYLYLIKANNETFSLQIKEIFLIVDKVQQQEIINNIKKNIDSLTGAKFDKSKYLYEEDNRFEIENGEKIFSYNRYNPVENYQVCMCYQKYIETIRELKDSFYWLLTQGGFIKEKEKVIGPLKSNKISLNRIKSKLDVNELSYLLFLLMEAKIFDADSKAVIGDMISKNFINQKGEHFDKDSISKKMNDKVSDVYKDRVLKELQSIINKNKK